MLSNAFTFDWDAPLAAEDEDKLIESIAVRIAKLGLESPAIWALEVHRPLFPLFGQGAIAFSPGLATFFANGAYDLQKVTKLMRSRESVDRLIASIESKSEEARLAARKR